MTDVKLRLLNRAFQGSLSIQILDDPPVSMRPKRARVAGHSLVEKSADLFNQSVGKVFIRSLVDAFVKLCARRIERKDPEPGCDIRRRRPQRPLTGNLLARLQIELDCALYSGPVARVQLACFV